MIKLTDKRKAELGNKLMNENEVHPKYKELLSTGELNCRFSTFLLSNCKEMIDDNGEVFFIQKKDLKLSRTSTGRQYR